MTVLLNDQIQATNVRKIPDHSIGISEDVEIGDVFPLDTVEHINGGAPAAYTKADHIDKVHFLLGLVKNTKDNGEEFDADLKVPFHLPLGLVDSVDFLQGLIDSVVINDQKKDLFEIGSVEQPLEKSVEMGSVHLVQEEIVKKDLFKPPKDIFNSIEQTHP